MSRDDAPGLGAWSLPCPVEAVLWRPLQRSSRAFSSARPVPVVPRAPAHLPVATKDNIFQSHPLVARASRAPSLAGYNTRPPLDVREKMHPLTCF